MSKILYMYLMQNLKDGGLVCLHMFLKYWTPRTKVLCPVKNINKILQSSKPLYIISLLYFIFGIKLLDLRV